MPNTVIDQNKTFEAIEERIAKTTNPRHLAMLKLVLTHAKGEAGPDLDMVMDTLGKHPAYHSWTARPEMSPVGREAVRDFYLREVVQAGRHFFQFVIDRMVVDDETVITEGYMTMLYTGGDAIATGLPVDDPDLAPIWEAMDETNLPYCHHSFFYEPPYFPGYRDIWGNAVVARTLASPRSATAGCRTG